MLFSATTGLLLDAVASPLYAGDLPAARRPAPAPGRRATCWWATTRSATYAHLALLLQANLHGLFPVHHSRIVDFTPHRPHCPEGKDAVAGMPRSRWVESLGSDDQLVEWFKPRSQAARG